MGNGCCSSAAVAEPAPVPTVTAAPASIARPVTKPVEDRATPVPSVPTVSEPPARAVASSEARGSTAVVNPIMAERTNSGITPGYNAPELNSPDGGAAPATVDVSMAGYSTTAADGSSAPTSMEHASHHAGARSYSSAHPYASSVQSDSKYASMYAKAGASDQKYASPGESCWIDGKCSLSECACCVPLVLMMSPIHAGCINSIWCPRTGCGGYPSRCAAATDV